MIPFVTINYIVVIGISTSPKVITLIPVRRLSIMSKRGKNLRINVELGLQLRFKFFNFYRPQRSCGQGYVFTCVCDSVHRGGLPQCMLGYHPSGSRPSSPPAADTPQEQAPQSRHPQSRHPLEQTLPQSRHTPRADTPQESRLQHMVNERLVRILLECILVFRAASQSLQAGHRWREATHSGERTQIDGLWNQIYQV